MKKSTLIVALTLCITPVTFAQTTSEQLQTVIPNGTHPSVQGPAEYFTGHVRIDPVFSVTPEIPASGAYVTFEPGARSAWHTHPLGQTLIVTQGVGWTQVWGGPIVEIKPGDVIQCPPGVKHWHGASPDKSMTHLTVTGTLPDGKNVDWMEKVSDTQYKK